MWRLTLVPTAFGVEAGRTEGGYDDSLGAKERFEQFRRDKMKRLRKETDNHKGGQYDDMRNRNGYGNYNDNDRRKMKFPFQRGDIVKGVITRIESYGAFVTFESTQN